MKKTILIIAIVVVLLLNVMSLFAQENVTINISQDARLALVGDNRGNEPFTPNLSFRSEWQGKQQKWGYMVVAPEFEYADLQGGIYRRYSANVGYTFNKWVKNIDFTSTLGYGLIDYNGGFRSFGSNFQISFTIFNGFKFFIDTEIVDRKDLTIYGDKTLGERLIVSGKAGFKINLKN